MITPEAREVLHRAKALYESRLKALLEPAHLHAFVAIVPKTGAYFLGKTLSEAANLAEDALPNEQCAVLRVGHKTTVHIGSSQS